jgi:hypothetical protein
VAENTDGLTIEQWNDAYPGCCFGKPQAAAIGGEPALRFPQGALDDNPRLLFRHDDFIFGLAGYVRSIPDSPKSPILSMDEFEEIVDGFRFDG